MGDAALVVASLVAGYLVGTFPTADLVARIATRGRVDIRAVGSGNPGGFNTMRSIGSAWGVAVIAVDLAKGVGAGFLGQLIGGDSGGYAAATAAVAGHVFPVWSHFRGGKGVATTGGAMLAVFPAFFPVQVAVMAVAALALRRSGRVVWLSSALCVGGAVLWWGAGFPNLWGPEVNFGLVVFAFLSPTMVLWKFTRSRSGV